MFWDDSGTAMKWCTFGAQSGLSISGTIFYWDVLNIAGLSTTPDNNSMMVFDGPSGGMLWEVGNILNTTLGLGTGDSPQFTGIELGHVSDTTITRASAGVIAVEGTNVMLVGDAPTAHTIAFHSDTTATGANLNTLVGGGDVGALHTHAAAYQPLDAGLTSLAGLTYVSDSFIKVTAEDTYAIRTIAQTKTDLSLNLVENTAHSTDAHTMTIDGIDVSAHAALNMHTAVADESADTSCYICYFTAATGDLAPKTGTNLTFNSNTGILTATGFAGALTGNVTGNCTGSSGSCTGQSATVATITGLAPDTATTQATQAGITTCANLTTVGIIGAGVWQGTSISTTYTDAKCTDATADNTAGNETSHANVLVDGDFVSNGILNRTGAGAYSILTLGTDVQAYHANLAAITAGTWTGAASITTLGTITTVGNITIANGGTIGQAAGPLLTFDDTNNYLEITGCKVGIGIVMPRTKLDICSTTPANKHLSQLILSDNTAQAVGVGGFAVFGGKYLDAGAMTEFAAIGGVKEDGVSGNYGGELVLYSRPNAGILVERVRIKANGYVGIGTIPPHTKLTIEGTLTLKEQAAADADTAAYGQDWVKNTVPCQRWFTDDTGVDYQLGGPTGSMMLWTTDTAPSGWLLCYGQAISRTTYASLFAIISTTFGVGDGSTTFNLPDMRGRFSLGQDDMGGTSANRVTNAQADSIGGAEGAETHTLTTTEMPAHLHSFSASLDHDGQAGVMGSTNRTGQTHNTNSIGGDGAHNNMSPYITLNYIIKH